MSKESMVINFMVEHLPDYIVHIDNGQVDWEHIIKNKNMPSSGEKAIIVFAAHLLDRPGVVAEVGGLRFRTLAALLGEMDAELRRDASDVLAAWALDTSASNG